MIKVIITTIEGRKTDLFPEHLSVRNAFEELDVDYTISINAINGSYLHEEDMDKALHTYERDSVVHLSSIVRADVRNVIEKGPFDDQNLAENSQNNTGGEDNMSETSKIQELMDDVERYRQAIQDARDALASAEQELDAVLSAQYEEEPF